LDAIPDITGNTAIRRDLNLFQIGWRFIERQLLRLLPFPLSLCSYI